jgi:hypothetical protein
MFTWYILLICEPCKEHEAYNRISILPEIDYIYPLFGEWDIIIRISGEYEELKEIVTKKIKGDGVLATKTLIGM